MEYALRVLAELAEKGQFPKGRGERDMVSYLGGIIDGVSYALCSSGNRIRESSDGSAEGVA